ncbi:unnamed protein product [Lathyrus oleraceus]
MFFEAPENAVRHNDW